MQRPRQATAPTWVHDGLAVYDLGAGPPLLVMPNPQGMVRAPEVCSPLVDRLVGLGWRVVTFDPPGAFASARPARLGLEEMLACTQEALAVAGVAPPVDVVGHSQATLCQLALALACPAAVGSLVLVGAVDGGWRTTRRVAGMPWCWPLTDPRRWRFAALGPPGGRAGQPGSAQAAPAALPGRLLRRPRPGSGGPHRARRPAAAAAAAGPQVGQRRPRRPAAHLAEISVPTLVCVGRHDPQTPWPANAAIAAALPAGHLEVFERSGHYPFIEEPDRFAAVVAAFLSSSPRSPGSKSRIRRDLRLHHSGPPGVPAMCFLDRVGYTWIQSTHWLPFLILRHCGLSLW